MSTPVPIPRPPIAPKLHESPLRPTADQTVVLYVVCCSSFRSCFGIDDGANE